MNATESAPPEVGLAASVDSASTSVGPGEAVRRAHRCRVARDYLGLEAYVVSEHRGAVSDLVRAVDRLASADVELRETVIRRLGRAAAMRVDRSEAANAIGAFSQEMEVIDERVDGDWATVTIQVAGRVPLEQVELSRREGRWLMQTDAPIAGVTDRIRELAEVLFAVARRVDRGEVSDAALERELQSQQAPVFRKLQALTAEPRS